MQEFSRERAKIKAMFGTIAPHYDFLNRLLSLGIDRSWRRAAAKMLTCQEGGLILDIATGTGDMALAAATAAGQSRLIVGVDFSETMVQLARKKLPTSPHGHKIAFGVACCEALPFRNNTFDSAVIAFGIRNVGDRRAGLGEIRRVLRPGGRLVVLELANPRPGPIRTLYHCYFRRFLPTLGSLFSDAEAYRYLPESVLAFPDTASFCEIMTAAGFVHVRHKGLTLGIATLFTGDKPPTPS